MVSHPHRGFPRLLVNPFPPLFLVKLASHGLICIIVRASGVAGNGEGGGGTSDSSSGSVGECGSGGSGGAGGASGNGDEGHDVGSHGAGGDGVDVRLAGGRGADEGPDRADNTGSRRGDGVEARKLPLRPS